MKLALKAMVSFAGKIGSKSARSGAAALLIGALGLAGCASVGNPENAGGDEPLRVRPLRVDPWSAPAGMGVCYGPFREGQSPTGAGPTDAQILEDLQIIARTFNVLRLYDSKEPAPTIVRTIHEHHLPLRVFVGAWIDPESRRDESGHVVESLAENVAANRREVEGAVALANRYPDVVCAVIVGNETQVFWSGHGVDIDVLIGHIRTARAQVKVPVTTADDFNFWNKPESDRVAREVDFVDNHAYAMWNGVQLDDAIAFTDEKMREIRAAHPDRLVLLGETGWATRKHTEGDQAKYIKGVPGEAEQAEFYRALRAWALRTRTIVLYFEAFDEPWKGGDHPNEVEKHWGLFGVDRRPKRALQSSP